MEGDSQNERSKALSPRRNSVGTWIIIGVLLALLAATGAMVYLSWAMEDASVPTSGYVAMAIGVVFSLVVGVGLMALVFYSSRRGYDEPAVLIKERDSDLDNNQKSGQETPGEAGERRSLAEGN